MQKISSIRILVLIVCLCVTSILVYLQPEGRTVSQSRSLEQSLGSLGVWKKVGRSSLSPIIVEKLELDDYVFQTYTNKKGFVTLYVGYYFTGKKVGAAHDPQVCYPSQGWKLSDKEQRSQQLKRHKKLDYSHIVAALDDKKEEIVYWFQVDDRSAASTFQQKLLLFKNKLFNKNERNAFVRISTSLNNKTEQQAERLIFDFIETFYPLFLHHISDV